MNGPDSLGVRRAAAAIVLALVLLGLLLLFTRHMLRTPHAEPPSEPVRRTRDVRDSPTLAPRESRTSSQAEVVDKATGDLRWGPLPGGTKFQQRLALGERLLHLRTRLQSGAVDTADVLQVLRRRTLRGSLGLDAWPRGLAEAGRERSEGEVAAALVSWMVNPRRDPGALTLHTPDAQDASLRIWTHGETFPPVDLDAGEALLQRLRKIAGDRSLHGYDVVATSGMGQELFSHSPLFHWGPPAAGLYATDDDLCLIRTIYPRGFQRVLLKHELVHAWAIRQRGPWASRFLEEGLAEYLSRLIPSDQRLTVPPRRFADEFAALLTLARRQRAYGFGVHTLSFERLMSLETGELYGLGQMGYLLAQAAVAYAGGDAVEAAVRERTEGPLRAVIRTLTWDQLVGFLEENAVGGRAGGAIVVEDLTPGNATLSRSVTRITGRRRPRHALQTIGIDVPDGLGDMALGDFLELPVSVLAQDRNRIRTFLSGLRTDLAGEVLLVSDATAAMLERFHWSPETLESLSELLQEPESIDSRAAFVERLLAGLERTRKGRPPAFLVWHGLIQPGSMPLPVMAGPVKTSDLLARLLRHEPAAPSLVVCIASLDGTREQMRGILAKSRDIPEAQVTGEQVTESLRNALSAYVRWMPRPPTRVLVVDLADGASDARLVAEVFADALGRSAPVALWNPQQPVR